MNPLFELCRKYDIILNCCSLGGGDYSLTVTKSDGSLYVKMVGELKPTIGISVVKKVAERLQLFGKLGDELLKLAKE